MERVVDAEYTLRRCTDAHAPKSTLMYIVEHDDGGGYTRVLMDIRECTQVHAHVPTCIHANAHEYKRIYAGTRGFILTLSVDSYRMYA